MSHGWDSRPGVRWCAQIVINCIVDKIHRDILIRRQGKVTFRRAAGLCISTWYPFRLFFLFASYFFFFFIFFYFIFFFFVLLCHFHFFFIFFFSLIFFFFVLLDLCGTQLCVDERFSYVGWIDFGSGVDSVGGGDVTLGEWWRGDVDVE